MEGNDSGYQGSILHQELEAHYQSMEKLYSVVLSIQYALNQHNFAILGELSQAKVVLLEDIQEKRSDLDKWLQPTLRAEESSPGTDFGPIRKIKNLIQEIEAVEASTASQLQELRRTDTLTEGFMRSHACGLTNRNLIHC